MTNEEILMPFFKQLYNKCINNDFVQDKSGVKIAEIWDCHIQGLNPMQSILEFNGRKSPIDYINKESKWYNSCSLNIKGYVDDVKIWQQVCDKDGFVNSNYGWCIYSKENYMIGDKLDKYPGAAGYKYIFIYMIAFAAAAIVLAFIINRVGKKNAAKVAE